MKNIIKIATILTIAISLNSCFLFGGGKSKCGDCPTWGQVEMEEDQIRTVETENV